VHVSMPACYEKNTKLRLTYTSNHVGDEVWTEGPSRVDGATYQYSIVVDQCAVREGDDNSFGTTQLQLPTVDGDEEQMSYQH
jgi:hypothetical protein